MAFASRIGRALRQAARITGPLPLRGADAGALSMPALHFLSRGMASSKLFVGGLSWGADENTLREAFSSYGEVIDVKIITDRDTGRSRGFGFVSFTNDNDAESALQAMDGRNLAGRTIRVDYAVQKPLGMGRGPGGGFGGGFGGPGGGYGAGSGGLSGGFGSGFGGGTEATGGANVKRDEFGFPLKNDIDLGDLDLLGTKDLDLLGTKKTGSFENNKGESGDFDGTAEGSKNQ